jgi:hypothetical protein
MMGYIDEKSPAIRFLVLQDNMAEQGQAKYIL